MWPDTVPSLSLVLVLLALGWNVESQALDAGTDAESESGQEGEAEADDAPLGPKDRRDVPDYDGREAPSPPLDGGPLWVPRIMLGPLFFVNDYILRRPIVALGTAVEKNYLPAKLIHTMTFGTGGQAGIYPTAFFSFGFRPSIGVTFWANQDIRNDARFRMHFAYGGDQWWLLDVRQRFYIGTRQTTNLPFSKSQVYLQFKFHERPDYIFYGLGPETQDVRTRYFRHQLGGTVGTEIVVSHLDGFGLAVTVENNRFGPGDPKVHKDEQSIEELFAVADPDQVPGYGGYTLATASTSVNLDSRRPRPAGGSGVRLELVADFGSDLQDPGAWFIRWGGELGLHADLTGHNRVLSLRQTVRLLEPMGDTVPAPFTELPSLGGNELLRGHHAGRYRGQSLFCTTLQYTYPIWVFLDGIVFFDAGNAFGHNLDGFAFQKLAGSFGMGLRSNSDRDASFHLLVAAGTTPFDAGPFKVDSFRFVIGAGRGF